MGFKSEKEYEDYLTDSGQWAYKRKFRKPTEPQRLAKDTKDDTHDRDWETILIFFF